MDCIVLDMGSDPKGECSLPGYEGNIMIMSFSHGVAMDVGGDGDGTSRASGRPRHQDLVVTKYLDAASPILNQACCEARVFPVVQLTAGTVDNGEVSEVIRYVLSDVIISSVTVGGGGGDRPVESMSLNYTRIEWQYNKGSVQGGWDLRKNAAE